MKPVLYSAASTACDPEQRWFTMGTPASSSAALCVEKSPLLLKLEPLIESTATPPPPAGAVKVQPQPQGKVDLHTTRLKQPMQQQLRSLPEKGFQKRPHLELDQERHRLQAEVLQRHQWHHHQQPQLQLQQQLRLREQQMADTGWVEKSNDLIEMSTAEFKAAIATVPELGLAVINQLKLARTRKRNRQYARRSRLRRKANSDQPASGGYAQKIDALQMFNLALRSSLETTQRPSANH
jgi:hypothetical protein